MADSVLNMIGVFVLCSTSAPHLVMQPALLFINLICLTFVWHRTTFPGSLTDLHRFRKTTHGHDGSSRIIMVRKTDQRTFASIKKGEETTFETVTRETVETFRGPRAACKFTTEKKNVDDTCTHELADTLIHKDPKRTKNYTGSIKGVKKKNSKKMDFQAECLKSHNEFRRKHGVAPLIPDREICKVSQQWADILIRKGALTHSNNRDYGENIFMIQSSNANFTISGREPVESWYEEIRFHNFDCEPKSLTSGHFTQVIWKGSKKLGVAYAKNGGKIIVVANYYPPGNMIGSFGENVPPLVETDNVNNNTIDLSDLSLVQRNPSKNLRVATEINFDEDFLHAHNMFRKRHGVKPLEMDKSLCKYAEEWAKHLASRNILEHRPESNYGENIYCLHSSDPSMTVSGSTPVDTWYKEINNHHFGVEPKNLKSGHLTQVIWKASEKLGVGVAKSTQGTIFVVANYFPAGNFVGHYVDNCPPLKPQFYNDQPFQSMSRNSNHEKPEHVDRNEGIDIVEFSRETLKVHNEYRRKHGVPDLIMNSKMCQFAQEWAEVCARTASLQHRANNTYGENIFSMYSSDYSNIPTARDVVKEWYDENKKYSFGDERVAQGCLHFTQVIWKDSSDLGVGVAKNKKGQTYVVCNYFPRGNYIGQFSKNVPKYK